MQYLSILEYEALYGTILNPNTLYINTKIQNWSRQIEELLGQSFGTTTRIKNLIIDVNTCGEYLFKFKAFQPTGIKVSVKLKGSDSWQLLTKGVDFDFIYPDFDTIVLNSAVILDPIVGVDFRCYRCNCECEEFKIEGLNFWNSTLPDDLKTILIDLLETLLKTDPNAYLDGLIPNNILVNDIESERDQTRSVSWFVDTDKIKILNKKLKDGVSFNDFFNIYKKYKLASLNLYKRFKL